METLGAFVRRIRIEKRLSCKDVEKRSARYGRAISGAYVNRIENQDKLNPTPDRLVALAKGLGIPPQELLARAAGVVSSNRAGEDLHFITVFNELSAKRQADVMKIVDMWHSEECRVSRAVTLIPNTERKK